MTPYKLNKINSIDQIVKDYFQTNSSMDEIPAKDLMSVFIENGIFKKNYRDGLPIRKLLRELDEENKLNLIKHSKVIRKAINRNWYFSR